MMNVTSFTICAIQPSTVWQEPERTFQRIDRLVGLTVGRRALDLVVLPEHFNGALENDDEATQWQAACSFAAALARQHRVNLVAGSVERWDETRQARVNTAVVFDRQGQEVGRYQKRRLFGYELQRGVLPGEEALVVELEGVRCGVLICADLWFPELVRALAGQIDLLCVPAQTTIRPESDPAYARMLWHTLAMTRAQENVIAVTVSDHAATAEAPFRCGGVASLTDPSAQPDLNAMQKVMGDGGAGFVVGVIDLARLKDFRDYRRRNGLLPPLDGEDAVTSGDSGESAPRSAPPAPAGRRAKP